MLKNKLFLSGSPMSILPREGLQAMTHAAMPWPRCNVRQKGEMQ